MIALRAMTRADLPDALRIASECWGRQTAQVAQPDFCEMFQASAWRPHFYVAEIDGRVVGMAGWKVSWLCYGFYDLFWIAVSQAHRRSGIGRSLVDRCLRDLDPVADAVVLATTIPEFYLPWGFKVVAKVTTAEGLADTVMIRERRP